MASHSTGMEWDGWGPLSGFAPDVPRGRGVVWGCAPRVTAVSAHFIDEEVEVQRKSTFFSCMVTQQGPGAEPRTQELGIWACGAIGVRPGALLTSGSIPLWVRQVQRTVGLPWSLFPSADVVSPEQAPHTLQVARKPTGWPAGTVRGTRVRGRVEPTERGCLASILAGLGAGDSVGLGSAAAPGQTEVCQGPEWVGGQDQLSTFSG